MIERIKSALARCGIDLWRINERLDETAELFFVKKQLDTRRSKDVHKFEVTVFRDVAADGKEKPARGFTSVQLIASMDDGEIDEKLKDAYYAAPLAMAHSRLSTILRCPTRCGPPWWRSTGSWRRPPWPKAPGRWQRRCLPPMSMRTPL